MTSTDETGSNRMTVEVAFARRDRQEVITLEVATGTTAIEAVRASGILDVFPEIDIASAELGIYGKRQHPDRVLEPHDRVEILRPLVRDPKEARRQRAGR